MRHAHPRFVTFEGVDGAGKSTHVEWFAGQLRQRTGAEVVVTREPGGTVVGEALRQLVLHEVMDLETETLIMFASRRQHLVDVIRPALQRGAWVVCDRFTDSTIAYQCGARGLPRAKAEALRAWVHPDLEPGHTVLFDLDPVVAQERMAGTRYKDRFEREMLSFFIRVRETFLELSRDPTRCFTVIDGAQSIAVIRNSLIACLDHPDAWSSAVRVGSLTS